MRARRLATRLVPHLAVFGLLASVMAWQHVAPAPGPATQDAHTLVATRTVPATEPGRTTPDGKLLIAKLAPRQVKPFTLLGVTWKSGVPKDAAVEVRWHRTTGAWSPWTDIHQELVPLEDREGRPGTEPQWVDLADQVAVRVTSSTPAKPVGLRVATVTPAKAIAAIPMAASQPAIITRAQWGASAQTTCSSPVYGSTTMGAVIHHTVGSNSYTAAESAGIVRAIQAYHMKARGWCDIGYNFLVDRFGQTFEGRAGGIDRPVRAAHAGNEAFNELTMGVSLMGTFDKVAPTDAMKNATVSLVAWRFGQYGLPATGPIALGGKTVERISGHRDVVSTDCPGTIAYAWLGAPDGLRVRVAAALSRPGSQTPAGLYTKRSYRHSLVLGWAPVAGAKAYRVRISRSPSFAGRNVVKDVRGHLARFSGLKRGRAFYFQIRTIKKNGKPLGGWSAPLTTATRYY